MRTALTCLMRSVSFLVLSGLSVKAGGGDGLGFSALVAIVAGRQMIEGKAAGEEPEV
jgi:hypothetical protein